MDLARISGLKDEELKDFLRLCGLRVTGKKEELVARVFVAVENNVPVQKSADAVQHEIAEEYAAKLFVAGNRIPDPLTLTHGCLSEEDSVRYWPVTLYPDIFNFLAFHPNELASTNLSDYKTSKAYSYFSQGWLAPLQFHATPTENSCATFMKPDAFQVDSLETIIADSTCRENFLAKVSEYFTVENVKAVEELTRDQNQNPSWNIFRRHVVTASEAHDVKTR
eukprot:gene4043-biopygen11865